MAEGWVHPKKKCLRTLFLCHWFINFYPVSEDIDNCLTSEQKFDILVKVDIVADQANDFPWDWVKLIVTTAFSTLNQKLIEELEEAVWKLGGDFYIFLDFLEEDNRFDCQLIVPMVL